MTRVRPRAAALVLVSAACLTTLAGCGGGASDGKSLSYWSMWTENEPQAGVLKAAIRDFTKDTGIKVDVQWQGRPVMEKLAPALTTGNVPDLIDQSDDKLYPTLVQSGRARDLRRVYERPATGEKKKLSTAVEMKYLEYLRKNPEGGRRTWLVPYQVTAVTLWRNGADHSVRAPATWDELLATCAALKKKDRDCIAVDGDQGAYTAWWFDYLVDRIGGDGTMAAAIKDKSGKGWRQPAVREAATKIRELVDKGYLIKGYDAGKYPEQQNRWAQGKAAFLLGGSWLPGETAKFAAKGFDFKPSPFPTAGKGQGDGRSATDVRLFGFAVPEQARNAGAAEKFISYFMARKRLSGIAEEAANITARSDIAAPDQLADVQKVLGKSPSREPLPGSTTAFEERVLFPAYQDLFLGKSSPSRFLSEIGDLHRTYVKTQH